MDIVSLMIPPPSSSWTHEIIERTLYLFTGLVLFLIFAGFIAWSIYEDEQITKSRIDSPVVGDYYVIDYKKIFDLADMEADAGQGSGSEYSYTVIKLNKLQDQSCTFLVSEYLYEKYTDAEDEIKDRIFSSVNNYFSKNSLNLTKDNILDFYENDVIKAVVRFENPGVKKGLQ